MKNDDIYYQAMIARDPRFDGKFFIGVKTTGIYCRPICPAKPKRKNVEFFHHRFDAEKAGYRPCMRCRPESAPQSPAWIGKSAAVQRALNALHTQDLNQFNEDQFADKFGMSARHLRRLFISEVGKTPKQIFFENRLNLSRQLIVETELSITEIAFGSGFKSIRRFNEAFKNRFKKSPLQIRRHKSRTHHQSGLIIDLAYRPPFDYVGLYQSYRNHQIGDLEWFKDEKMYRVLNWGHQFGYIVISNNEPQSKLRLEIHYPDLSKIHLIVSKVRQLFDLGCDPVLIANQFDQQKKIKYHLKKFPGIRLASGWDPFEIAVSTILGQLVSTKQARALVQALIMLAGKNCPVRFNNKTVRLFPTPKDLIHADLAKLKTTKARKMTLVDFAKAIDDGRLSLEPTQDVDRFLEDVQKIKGIGPWTAQYMALKVLKNTDSFPGSDLVLKRWIKSNSDIDLNQLSPWRGYLAALIWRNHTSEQL